MFDYYIYIYSPYNFIIHLLIQSFVSVLEINNPHHAYTLQSNHAHRRTGRIIEESGPSYSRQVIEIAS